MAIKKSEGYTRCQCCGGVSHEIPVELQGEVKQVEQIFQMTMEKDNIVVFICNGCLRDSFMEANKETLQKLEKQLHTLNTHAMYGETDEELKDSFLAVQSSVFDLMP